jgi:hypothetical protein
VITPRLGDVATSCIRRFSSRRRTPAISGRRVALPRRRRRRPADRPALDDTANREPLRWSRMASCPGPAPVEPERVRRKTWPGSVICSASAASVKCTGQLPTTVRSPGPGPPDERSSRSAVPQRDPASEDALPRGAHPRLGDASCSRSPGGPPISPDSRTVSCASARLVTVCPAAHRLLPPAAAVDTPLLDSRSAREPKTGGMRVQSAVTPSPRPAPPLAEESSLNPRWSGGHVKITSYPSRVMWHAGKRIGRGCADA